MTYERKIELVKRLESLVIFQKNCLDSGDWGDYDHAEMEIKNLENKIIFADNDE